MNTDELLNIILLTTSSIVLVINSILIIKSNCCKCSECIIKTKKNNINNNIEANNV